MDESFGVVVECIHLESLRFTKTRNVIPPKLKDPCLPSSHMYIYIYIYSNGDVNFLNFIKNNK